MKRSLVVRRIAQREFDEAADWYDRQRTGLGTEFIDEIQRVFDSIMKNPLRFGVVQQDFREALANRFPYAVYYRVEPQRVVIMAVLHTSRDPAIWQERPLDDPDSN
jgi:plasmid stabilization system protein ParE